jgi:pimeloyl-ACP methyl ester carboxylesterase
LSRRKGGWFTAASFSGHSDRRTEVRLAASHCLGRDTVLQATQQIAGQARLAFLGHSIDELAEDMRRTLTAKGVTAHKKLIFLSHSMGGLVTRAYLLKNRDIAARTSFAYFFSTPTSGSQIASIANLFLSSPQIVKMMTMNPEEYLGDLLRQWLAAGFKFPSYCAYEKKPTMGVSLVVTMGSAVQLCTKAVDPIDADHINIVKPESPDSPPVTADLDGARTWQGFIAFSERACAPA